MTYEAWAQKEGTKGLAFLVTNCDDDDDDFLAGTIHDHDNWMRALTKLNLDVRWERNLNKSRMKDFLKTATKIRLNPGCKYVIFVFSGHGAEGVLYSQDGRTVSLQNDICPPFFQGNMSHLHKLFFLDACRSKNESHPLTLSENLFESSKDGTGGYFAFCPVPPGKPADDDSAGSRFSKVVTDLIVKDRYLHDIVEDTRLALEETARTKKKEPMIQPVLNHLPGPVNLFSLAAPAPPPVPPIVPPSPNPTVLQRSPTDAGLQGVIKHPGIGLNWPNLAIALGVPDTYIDTSSRPVGLSAFKYWSNGQVKGAQTTWEFLLERVTETFGPQVTEKLKEDISSHPLWTT